MSGFDVAVLKTPMWTAAENLDFFQYQGALSATVPVTTDRGRLFGIATEETPKGFTAPFQIQGLVRVRLNVVSTSHPYADIDPMNRKRLKSGFSGSARIIWQEPGTGEKWAIMQLGILDEHEIIAVTDQQIEPDGFGNASVWYAGNETSATEVLWLTWMHNDEAIPAGCEVLARWFVDQRKWVIVGAECKTAPPPLPTSCDSGDYFDDFDHQTPEEGNWTSLGFQFGNSFAQNVPNTFNHAYLYRCGPNVGPVFFFSMEVDAYLPIATRFDMAFAGLWLAPFGQGSLNNFIRFFLDPNATGLNKLGLTYLIGKINPAADTVDITSTFIDGQTLRFEMELVDLNSLFYRFRFFLAGQLMFDVTPSIPIEWSGNMEYGMEYRTFGSPSGTVVLFDAFRTSFV